MADISQVRVNNTDYNFADDTKVPYDLLQDTVGFTSKNLIPFPYYGSSKTEQGITFTINADGSVKANGTSTGTAIVDITSPLVQDNTFTNKILAGKYIISGGYSNNAVVRMQINNTSGTLWDSTGGGTEIDLVNDTTYKLYIRIASGQTLNNVTFYPMLRKADIMDSTYEQYRKPVPQYIEDRIKNTVGWSSKNLFTHYNSQVSPRTENGITFITNEDKSITINGTATADVYFSFDHGSITKRGMYIYSKGIDNSDIGIGIDKRDGLTYVGRYGSTREESMIFDYNDSYTPWFWIIVPSGKTVNNVTVYPMLRLAEDLSPTYEPHNPSVKQVLRNNKIIEGKNLIPFPYTDGYSKTQNGITFTVNGDGSITANGTATTYAEFALMKTEVLQDIINKGDLILSLSGTVNSNCIVYLRKTSGYITVTGNSYAGIPSNTTLYDQTNGLYIQVRPDATVNNIVFRPMLCKATETDPTYEQYYIPGVVSQEAQNILGAKNLVPIWRDFGSPVNGVTITCNDDGSYKLNGTATANVFITIGDYNQDVMNKIPFIPNHQYKLTGCASGSLGSSEMPDNYSLRVYFRNASNQTTYLGSDRGNGVIVTIPDNAVVVFVQIAVKSGTILNNVVFKPMFRPAEIKDDTFCASSLPSIELTKRITPRLTVNHTLASNKYGVEFGDNFKNKVNGNPNIRVVQCGNIVTVSTDVQFNESIESGSWASGVFIKNLPKPFDLPITGIIGFVGNDESMICLQLHIRDGIAQLEFVKNYTIPANKLVRLHLTYIAYYTPIY